MGGVVRGLADGDRHYVGLLHGRDLQHDARWEVLFFGTVSSLRHEGLGDQRVHVAPETDDRCGKCCSWFLQFTYMVNFEEKKTL
jgi:hypothetical protein